MLLTPSYTNQDYQNISTNGNGKVGLSAEELGNRAALVLDGKVGRRPGLGAVDDDAGGRVLVEDDQQVRAGTGRGGLDLAELPGDGSVVARAVGGDVWELADRGLVRVGAGGVQDAGDLEVVRHAVMC